MCDWTAHEVAQRHCSSASIFNWSISQAVQRHLSSAKFFKLFFWSSSSESLQQCYDAWMSYSRSCSKTLQQFLDMRLTYLFKSQSTLAVLRLAINLFDWPLKSTAQSDESVLASIFLTLFKRNRHFHKILRQWRNFWRKIGRWKKD